MWLTPFFNVLSPIDPLSLNSLSPSDPFIFNDTQLIFHNFSQNDPLFWQKNFQFSILLFFSSKYVQIYILPQPKFGQNLSNSYGLTPFYTEYPIFLEKNSSPKDLYSRAGVRTSVTFKVECPTRLNLLIYFSCPFQIIWNRLHQWTSKSTFVPWDVSLV